MEKYRTLLEGLPPAERGSLVAELGLPRYARGLVEMVQAAGLGQADLVLALLRVNTAETLAVAEAVLGRTVTRCPPGVRDAPPTGFYSGAQWVLRLLGPENGPDARRVAWLRPNPRLPTTPSWGRFRVLRVGLSVSQALVRGVTRRDMREWTHEGSVGWRT